MPTRYVSEPSTWFYNEEEPNRQEFLLLYGDEIETTGNQDDSGNPPPLREWRQR